jgi:hypothetical protein
MSRCLTRLSSLRRYSCSNSINARLISASCLDVIVYVSDETSASGTCPVVFTSQLKRFYAVGISRCLAGNLSFVFYLTSRLWRWTR